MAASVGNAVGAIGGISKISEGRKMQREAQKFIESFEWKDLTNAADGLQVSTLGSELLAEESSRGQATNVEALRGAGARGVIGGMGAAQMAANKSNREIATNLDEQQKAINMFRAQDEVNIRGMKEKRQTDELAGYGTMLDVGRSMKYGGVADVQAAGQAQSQHNMELFETFGGGMSGMG